MQGDSSFINNCHLPRVGLSSIKGRIVIDDVGGEIDEIWNKRVICPYMCLIRINLCFFARIIVVSNFRKVLWHCVAVWFLVPSSSVLPYGSLDHILLWFLVPGSTKF